MGTDPAAPAAPRPPPPLTAPLGSKLSLLRKTSIAEIPPEETRVALLMTQSTTPTTILEAYGEGLRGSISLLAHYITWQTECFVYGGYLRDFVVGGEHHSEMDLDISLPKEGPKVSGQTALAAMVEWAAKFGITLKKTFPKGNNCDVLVPAVGCSCSCVDVARFNLQELMCWKAHS
jgi:hypothetical protein